MMAIATGGLAVNIVGLLMLSGGKDHSLNMHGAWLHLLTDALGSVAALAAGGLIWAFGWNWADPVASMLIGLLVIYSSWDLVTQAIDILMESTPAAPGRRTGAHRHGVGPRRVRGPRSAHLDRSPAAWNRSRPTSC